MENEKKLVGVEVVDKSIALEGQDVVGKVSAQHVGKIGKFELLPLIYKGIDQIEKIIPGDQTLFATMAKEALSKIKIKF